MPGKNSCDSPRIRVGRPAISELTRSAVRSSMGLRCGAGDENRTRMATLEGIRAPRDPTRMRPPV